MRENPKFPGKNGKTGKIGKTAPFFTSTSITKWRAKIDEGIKNKSGGSKN